MVDPSKKKAFIMVGFPGSGKSTLARKIVDAYGYHYLSSDQFRKRMFNQSRYGSAKDNSAIKQSAQAYTKMYEKAIELLGNDMPVVIDATHLIEKKRNRVVSDLLKICQQEELCFVTVNTPKNVIDNRMSKYIDVFPKNKNGGQKESLYEAWKRVYGYFSNQEKQGIITWPNNNQGIEIITHEEIQTLLDK